MRCCVPEKGFLHIFSFGAKQPVLMTQPDKKLAYKTQIRKPTVISVGMVRQKQKVPDSFA